MSIDLHCHAIQLSTLCRLPKLKEVGYTKSLEPLISCLNILTENRILIPLKSLLKGGIASFFCTDNIGSNF